MANTFKKVIDRNMWVQSYPAPNAHAAGVSLCSDMRNDLSRNPLIYQLVSNTVLNRYNIITKGWNFFGSPALGGTFGAGAGCVFVPSFANQGTCGAGCTTTVVVTGAGLFTTAVGVNMLANRGGSGDYGFKVRIYNVGSGLTAERWIIGNTGATNPTLLLDQALPFTPANGDVLEILAGRVFMLGASTLAAASFRQLTVADNTLSNGGTTNLPATISMDCSFVCLDEQYVPYNHIPGEGFVVDTVNTYDATYPKRCLVSTATALGTITGQATGGDAAVLQNEYRNFQIRIVEDTTAPTAVGQRRIIASHTAGASPVYTLGTNWAVTPSAGAKFVIEYPNLLLLWSSGSTTTFVYNYTNATINNGTNSINAGAWHVTYFAVRPGAMAAGCTSFPSFGIQPDSQKYARHSFIFSFRGGAAITLDLLDIAGGTAGVWTGGITYDGAVTLTTGSCGGYAPFDNEGKFGYLNSYVASQINQIYRFDVKSRVLTPFTPTDWLQTGTAVVGDRMKAVCAIDGTDKYTCLLLLSHTTALAYELLVLV